MRRLVGWALSGLALVGVLAVVAVATFDALRGTGEEAPRSAAGSPAQAVRGPHVPAPGALPGTLYVAEARSCRLQALDLEQLTLGEPGPATSCRLWMAPGGQLAVASRRSRDTGSGLELVLVRLGDPPSLVRVLGSSRSAPAWSPDGTSVAWCDPGGGSVLLHTPTGSTEAVPGCYPSFLATGVLATREGSGPRTILLEDGHAALDQDDIAGALSQGAGSRSSGPRQAMPARVWITGTGAAADGSLLVAVRESGTGFSASGRLQRWREGRLTGSLTIPSVYEPAAWFYGFRIEVSPGGTEAAFVFPERSNLAIVEDLAALIDLRSGRAETELLEQPYAGFAWSPDGAWLAVASGREIRIYGADRSTPAYVLPVAAGGLAWAS